ncbi:MAG: glycogen-binding domain-containing protein [Syntrophobacteraceae bacterium]|jgi:hypothetical protein
MEKKEPEEPYDAMADRIKTMIREMPQIQPPVRLLPAVMEAVKAKRGPLWLRAYRWARSPISVTFTPLRLVSAMALSALLVFSAFFLHERQNRNITLAESHKSIPVVFALDMPDAHSVQVIGSFNNWVPQPCELRKDNGAVRWILTVSLQPGRYEYAFLVDRKHMPHPHAELYQDDGFGDKNSVLALLIADSHVPVEVSAQKAQTDVTHAVEEARKAAIDDATLKGLLALGYEKGVEPESMANLVRIVSEVKMENLPLEPFVSKIKEGMAKGVPAGTIERVLNQKRQDYQFTRLVAADYLKKNGLPQEVAFEELVAFTESLYSGLSREDLTHTMEQSPTASLSILNRAVHLRASLKQLEFDEKLSDQIVSTGLEHNFFTPQQCGFARAIVAGKRKGLSDSKIAEAALLTMRNGGTVAGFCSQIGISSSDMTQHGPQIISPTCSMTGT